MRHTLVHHHIFKNSGTTFDNCLKNSFSNDCFFVDSEFPFFRFTKFQINKICNSLKTAQSISSHQFVSLPDNTKDVTYYSITFLRNPFLRIRSIYNFKKKINDGTTISNWAQEMSFSDWLEACILDKHEILHVNNSQSSFFCTDYDGKPLRKKNQEGFFTYDIEICKKTLDDYFFCGLTENFSISISTLNKKLEKIGIKQLKESKPENVTISDINLSVHDRVDSIKKEIGKNLFDKLQMLNEQDLILCNYVKDKFL